MKQKLFLFIFISVILIGSLSGCTKHRNANPALANNKMFYLPSLELTNKDITPILDIVIKDIQKHNNKSEGLFLMIDGPTITKKDSIIAIYFEPLYNYATNTVDSLFIKEYYGCLSYKKNLFFVRKKQIKQDWYKTNGFARKYVYRKKEPNDIIPFVEASVWVFHYNHGKIEFKYKEW